MPRVLQDLQDPLTLTPAVEPLTLPIIAKAIWGYLPELTLINSELWIMVVAVIWCIGSLSHANQVGYAALTIVFGLPGLLATVFTLRLAVKNRDDA